MKGLILAGGFGTRLWPLSCKNLPKQFLSFGKKHSLLQETYHRCCQTISPKDLFVVTNPDLYSQVCQELAPFKNVLAEPMPKNTAPAIAYGMKHFNRMDEPVFITPSDHWIEEGNEEWTRMMGEAEILAKKGFIVTFGVPPTRAETGYGYIRADKDLKVEQFTEKPSLEVAKEYVASGKYFWNSGMFCLTPETFFSELEAHAPELAKAFTGDIDDVKEQFSKLPSLSIDYAIMEKSRKVVVLPFSLKWCDIGSWDALYENFHKDANGNAIRGEVSCHGTENCMIYADEKQIVTSKIKDLLIVEAGDSIIVSHRGESIKSIIQDLPKREPKTSYRPWGYYTILNENDGSKVKRIGVYPGKRTSLQYHHHRSEHWVITTGIAKIVVGDETVTRHPNESIFIPKEAKHRVENPGSELLEFIEVQYGNYLEEDDIVRIEDDYGRAEVLCP